METPPDLWLCSPVNVTPIRFNHTSTEISPYASQITPFKIFDSDGSLITGLFDFDNENISPASPAPSSSQPFSSSSQIAHLMSPFKGINMPSMTSTNPSSPNRPNSSPSRLSYQHQTPSRFKEHHTYLFESPLTPLTNFSSPNIPLLSSSSSTPPFSDDLSPSIEAERKSHLKRRNFTVQQSPLDSNPFHDGVTSLHLQKKARTTLQEDEEIQDSVMRTFPEDAMKITQDVFPRFYTKYYISGQYKPQHETLSPLPSSDARHLPHGSYNPPRHGPFDLYTPRYVKGSGHTKMGLCPICFEPTSRGGDGRSLWLGMKISAFKCTILTRAFRVIKHLFNKSYHMQYAHGVSPVDGLPFSPPIDFRIVPLQVNTKPKSKSKSKSKNESMQATDSSLSSTPSLCQIQYSSGICQDSHAVDLKLNSKIKMTVASVKGVSIDSLRSHIMQGLCHHCKKWIAVEGVKDVENKVKEVFWWKHAAACHRGSKIPGEGDFFVQDKVFQRLKEFNEQ